MAAVGGSPHRRYLVCEEEDVGALRRAVSDLAARSSTVRAADAALVATELGTNLIRHATSGGYVLFRSLPDGIELVAVDRGPGMLRSEVADSAVPSVDPGRWRPNHPPSARGLGVGLDSVKRMASTFDIYSTPEGTVVLARLGARPSLPGWCQWGAVNIPAGGEGESGDGWAVSTDGSLVALVVDGLGHGPAAASASRAAISVFAEQERVDLVAYVAAAHEAMRGGRGGVLGICAIDPDREELSYVGVGNITTRLLGTQRSTLAGREGSMGTQLVAPRARLERHRWEPGATLIMASDGLRTQWELDSYSGLLRHDPVVIASVLERDYGRGTDDATVLVVHDCRKGGQ